MKIYLNLDVRNIKLVSRNNFFQSMATAAFIFSSSYFMVGALANDIELQDLQGTWNNSNTGENIKFLKQDVFDSRYGQGRIGMTEDWAANFRITYQGNEKCWFYVTPTDLGNRLNFSVRNPSQSGERCLSGVFERVGDPRFVIKNKSSSKAWIYINSYDRLASAWEVAGPYFVGPGDSVSPRSKGRILRRYFPTFYLHGQTERSDGSVGSFSGNFNFQIPNGEVRGFMKLKYDCDCPVVLGSDE